MGFEPAVCTRCEEKFDRPVTHIGGRTYRGPGLCPPCTRDEERPEQRVSVRDNVTVLELLESAGANVKRHGRITLAEWDSGSHGETALSAARQFVGAALASGRFDPVRGLYVCGPPGTGKTQLAIGIARCFLAETSVDPTRVVIDRAERLVTMIRDTYGHGGTEAILAKRERAVLWVLDDFGAENAAEDVLRVFTDLLSAREGWPTVITSNLHPDGVAERWTSPGWARLQSRLGTQNFRTVSTKGDDRRHAA